MPVLKWKSDLMHLCREEQLVGLKRRLEHLEESNECNSEAAHSTALREAKLAAELEGCQREVGFVLAMCGRGGGVLPHRNVGNGSLGIRRQRTALMQTCRIVLSCLHSVVSQKSMRIQPQNTVGLLTQAACTLLTAVKHWVSNP